MSEPNEQDEITEPGVTDVPEPDQEPTTHEPSEEEEEAEEGAQEPPEPPEPQVDAAKEQRRVAGALKREHEAHDKKLEKILGAAHEHVLACPLCGDGLQGYVFPGDGQMLDDERKGQVLAFLGEQAPQELKPAVGVEMCDHCDGIGQLAYPTRNPHVKNQQCPSCIGQGYVPVQQQQQLSNVTPLGATEPTYVPTGEVGPCPICGAPNSAGKPHFCNPVQAVGT